MLWPDSFPSAAKRGFILAAVVLIAGSAFPGFAQSPAEGKEILEFLDRTIGWHRQVSSIAQSPANPREALLTETLRDSSVQAVRLAFDFAEAEAAALELNSTRGEKSGSTRGRNLANAEAAIDQRLETLQRKIDELNRRIETSPGALRAGLISQRDVLTAQFNLTKARRDSLHGVLSFLNAPQTGGLSETIKDLERSVPELAAAAKPDETTAIRAASQDFRPEAAGIVGLTTQVLTLTRRIRQLSLLAEETESLRQEVVKRRAPLRKAFQEVTRRSDEITKDVETESTEELKTDKQALDALLLRFKQLTGTAGPLGRLTMPLDAARSNLVEWRSVLHEQHTAALRYLLLRLATLGVAILVIVIFSEMWRRATMRYVRDIRRRRQFLLLRRAVVGCGLALLVVLSFVTEFGSLATFAGFSAAGIAVAMQSVIISVVAYFFLVGRWGVRVGDRITVSGVTGQVIEIGLFRMYLMELSGAAMGLHPTGRIVFFPNAVFFQPAAMFKQLPGVDYTWHTVSITLSRDCDHALAEKQVMVESVYGDYRKKIESQHEAARTSFNLHTDTPRPEARVRFVDSGVELAVRYPVEFGAAAATDDRITRELLDLIATEPNLQLHIAGTPKIT